VCVCVVEFFGGSLADGADFDFVEVFGFVSALEQAFHEELDAVGARENQPVVAVEVSECFVEAIVVVGFTNLDCWANKHLGAVALERVGQFRRLRRRARDYDRSSLEWLICHKKSQKSCASFEQRCSEGRAE
jgi:hypothetical protein